MCTPAATDVALAYELRRSPRRRTLSVEVHRDLRVVVRAPAAASARFIDEQVAQRRPWIERTLARFRRDSGAVAAPLAWEHGAVHVVSGEPCRIVVTRGPRTAVTRADGCLQVALRCAPSALGIRRALEAWYREYALSCAHGFVAAHFALFAARGHQLPDVAIRRMTTRWGSLVGRRRMTLNLALVHGPLACFEYVVVHELCHLEHRGHGHAFYQLLGQLLPDWRERRRYLQTVSHVLPSQ